MAKHRGILRKIINLLLVIVIVAGAVGIVSHFTNGFTSKLSTFSVECNGKEVTTSLSGIEMTEKEPLTVKIKYTFGGDKVSGYSIKVVPNTLAGKDFDFTVDGQVYSYQAEKDLTAGFDVQYNEKDFVITPKGNLTGILQANYLDKVVEDCHQYSYKDMFTLIVYSYNGEDSVKLNFSVPDKVYSIELDKGVIIF